MSLDKFEFARKAFAALLEGNIHAALTYLKQHLDEEAPPPVDVVEEVWSLLRAKYRERVQDAAGNIFDDYCNGEYDGSEEALSEDLDSVADSHCTYTSVAQECLLFSNNDSIGPEELGADSFDWKSGVPWSQLAYYAFRADVHKALEDMGIDGGQSPPARGEIAIKCEQCGNVRVAMKNSTTCNECEEENGNEQCSECEIWYSPENLLDGVCEECCEPKTEEGQARKDPGSDDRGAGVP